MVVILPSGHPAANPGAPQTITHARSRTFLAVARLLPLLLLLLPAGTQGSLPAATGALLHRFKDITSRPAWRHESLLPPEALARASAVHGNTARLTAVARKLILGQPILFTHIGGPWSQPPPTNTVQAELTWPAIFHRWLELTFTKCGLLHPSLLPRSPQPSYTTALSSCNASTVRRHSISHPAATARLTSDCLLPLLDATQPSDLLLLDLDLYSDLDLDLEAPATDPQASVQGLRDLEQLLRRAWALPARPALLLLHSLPPSFSPAAPGGAGGAGRPAPGPELGAALRLGSAFHFGVEDWHGVIGQYYGAAQVLSVRNALFEVWRAHGPAVRQALLAEPQPRPGAHTENAHTNRTWGRQALLSPLGHQLLADLLVSSLKQAVRRSMAEMLMESVLPRGGGGGGGGAARRPPQAATSGSVRVAWAGGVGEAGPDFPASAVAYAAQVAEQSLPPGLLSYSGSWTGLPHPLQLVPGEEAGGSDRDAGAGAPAGDCREAGQAMVASSSSLPGSSVGR